MKLPPLPDPEIIDGRRLYTAGQMREYARMCVGLVAQKVTESDPIFSKPTLDKVADLLGIFGMKK